MDKKEKIKKVLFYIAILLNVFVLIETYKNLVDYQRDLLGAIGEAFAYMNIILPFSTFYIICYPIYYLFNKRKTKQTKSYFTVYLLSFLPYLFLIYVYFFGVDLGYSLSMPTYGIDVTPYNDITDYNHDEKQKNNNFFDEIYNTDGTISSGLAGMSYTFLIGILFIPVYLALLTFQILYKKQNYKDFTKTQKNISNIISYLLYALLCLSLIKLFF